MRYGRSDQAVKGGDVGSCSGPLKQAGLGCVCGMAAPGLAVIAGAEGDGLLNIQMPVEFVF